MNAAVTMPDDYFTNIYTQNELCLHFIKPKGFPMKNSVSPAETMFISSLVHIFPCYVTKEKNKNRKEIKNNDFDEF